MLVTFVCEAMVICFTEKECMPNGACMMHAVVEVLINLVEPSCFIMSLLISSTRFHSVSANMTQIVCSHNVTYCIYSV